MGICQNNADAFLIVEQSCDFNQRLTEFDDNDLNGHGGVVVGHIFSDDGSTTVE